VDAWVWILIVVAALAIAAFAYLAAKRKRSDRLRQRFGPEYDRAVSERGDRGAGEAELLEREKRREKLDIVSLEPDARERYAVAWRETQARFVDAPSEAVAEADRLVQRVMQERGYPVDTFDQRESDITVDHPHVARDYRAAHGISLASQNGEATTEDLREAMVHYRALFENLLGSDDESDRVREAR
jgi:hypothetical protein